MFISYAQNFEDVMLRRALKSVARGFYIDVGAQDPIVDSVSRGFYEQGWRGVHVEPVEAYVMRLRANRPDEIVVQAALGAIPGTLLFNEVIETGLSSADPAVAAQHRDAGRTVRAIEVRCTTLDEIMAPYAGADIHWLKIDVEGYERAVLQGWTSSVKPWIVLVESTVPLTQIASHGDWEDLVLAHGYAFAYFDGLNRFYIRADREDLRPAFAHGPCVFDHFALHGTATSTHASWLNAQVREATNALEAIAAQSKSRVDAAERRALEATHRAARGERHIAVMEATISWRLTTPLRWLSRQKVAARESAARALRGSMLATLRAGLSVTRRSGVLPRVTPWMQARYPRLWRKAKSLAGSTLSSAISPAAVPWEPRTTRDVNARTAADIEARLKVEIQQRRRS
jgi:FkbM family methyltransferase